LKNLDSFIIENKLQMKSKYDPNDNNSMDIFTKKINVLDNSIFRKEYIEEIFKDKTRISNEINKYFKFCYKFYYTKNYSINLTVKNIHIRFEDDQLINYTGDISLGCKIDILELILSSEGNMKKDSCKISKLNVYWENPAKILIPSDILNMSIHDGKLDEEYYINLKKIKFQQFKYNPNTKLIIENFSFSTKFGTHFVNNGKMDLFGKSSKEYKFFFKLISNEINFNFYPDLMIINDNFNKFVTEFSVIDQVQNFKPMKKPYNIKTQTFIQFMEIIKQNKNPKYFNNFMIKKKLLVRDWLFYFFWCQKCKSSLIGRKINPLRMEFSRFYNLCFSPEFQSEFNTIENKENNNENENKTGIEDYNPDKISISYISDISIKGFNINLHPSIKNKNLDFTYLKMNEIIIKISLLKTLFDFGINCKSIIFSPDKLCLGEKVFISNISKNKKEQQKNIIKLDNYNSNDYMENSYSRILDNIEENTGLTGLVQKYNPNYKLKLKLIDEALEKIGTTKKKNSFNDTEISVIYNKNNDNNSQIYEVINNSNININLNDSKGNNNNYIIPVNNNITKSKKGKKILK
jgi:hypothetical protein